MCHVYGRFRPFNRNESATNSLIVSKQSNEHKIVISDNNNVNFSFNLDQVYYETTTQPELYNTSIIRHVKTFVDSTNDMNIITYGQTSSGKTWTIDGDFYNRPMHTTLWSDELISNDPCLGILPRTLWYLCKRYGHRLRLAYYEIYCEKVYDLLVSEENNIVAATTTAASTSDKVAQQHESKFTEIYGNISIDVKEWTMPTNNITSTGSLLSTTNAENVEDNEAIQCYIAICRKLQASNKRRHFNETAMNAHSSRSHTFIELRCPTARKSGIKTLRIIDLAGSERADKTLAKNKILTEGININNSLMYLKQMIEIIARHKPNQTMPKFRESKLTRIVYASINSNSACIVLILCCSPSTYNFNETLNTLRFGSTAIRVERETTNRSEQELLSKQQVERLIVGLYGDSLIEHNEQLVRQERAKAHDELRKIETALTEAQLEERRQFESRINEYEDQIYQLKQSMEAQSISVNTLRECHETISLQRHIINELTEERIRLRKELKIYKLFREYIFTTLCDDNNDEQNYQQMQQRNTKVFPSFDNFIQKIDKKQFESNNIDNEDEQRKKIKKIIK